VAELAMDLAIRPPQPAPQRAAHRPKAADDGTACVLCRSAFDVINWRLQCGKCARHVCSDCSSGASWASAPEYLVNGVLPTSCKLCVAPTRSIPGLE
jgi:hypothetical protein